MKVAVWGAGQVGLPLAYRLATCDFVSGLVWINRDVSKIAARVVDIEHGLALVPCCRSAEAIEQQDAKEMLAECSLVVLTQGAPVSDGGNRDALLATNQTALQSAVAALEGFNGIVLVITNPVDGLTRWIHEQAGLPEERIVGLGTVVETARLRCALAGLVVPAVPPRSIWCFAGAIARDSGDIHTVSVKDTETRTFFSVPVSLGRRGVVARHLAGIAAVDLDACRKAAANSQESLGRSRASD